MKQPHEMTPIEMREHMKDNRIASNEVHFRNKNGDVIFTAIYVEGKDMCKVMLDAAQVVSDAFETENVTKIIKP